MRSGWYGLVIGALAIGCAKEGTTKTHPETDSQLSPTSNAASAAPPASEVAPAADTSSRAGAPPQATSAETAVAEAQPEPPDAPLIPAKGWPFYQWDNARAYIFNLDHRGPQFSLYVYSEPKGWNPTVVIDKPISRGLAKTAISLIHSTKGEMLVSKCPLPRHAVVLFSGSTPVASMNVCFACGDILIWPPYDRSPDWEERKDRMYEKLMASYDRVFPRWTSLFAKDFGMETDWKKISVPEPGKP